MWHEWERGEKRRRFWWKSPEGKRPLVRASRIWEDVIRMDLRVIGGGGEWFHTAAGFL
jgi:hypothetical protein